MYRLHRSQTAAEKQQQEQKQEFATLKAQGTADSASTRHALPTLPEAVHMYAPNASLHDTYNLSKVGQRKITADRRAYDTRHLLPTSLAAVQTLFSKR
jgi:hypothetical protein